MRTLETKIPPPIIMVLLGVLAWVCAHYLPFLSFALPFNKWIAAVLAVTGLVLNVLPKLAFGRAGTTLNPMRPDSATHLVTSGIYRYTRNPMYLGHTLILLGWAAFLHNAAALLAVPVFMLYISRFQIQAEESQLAVRFPATYAAFCKQTPRWL